jgi:hypothetical protein
MGCSTIPLGPLNCALFPDPSANPELLPAMVVTWPTKKKRD